MSTTYTPNGTYSAAAFTLPEDGEIINEAVLVDGILKRLIDDIGVNAARTWTAAQTFEDFRVTKAPKATIGTVPDANTTIDVSKPFYEITAAATIQRDLTLDETTLVPESGQYIDLKSKAAGAASWIVKRQSGTAVCTLTFDATKICAARVYWDGTNWRLGHHSEKVVPGAGA